MKKVGNYYTYLMATMAASIVLMICFPSILWEIICVIQGANGLVYFMMVAIADIRAYVGKSESSGGV